MSQDKNNENLSPLDYMRYVISATLSSFETGTWFYTRDNGLKKRLEELYSHIDHPFIKGNKISDIGEPRNDLVRECLSISSYYGQNMGLSNYGFDYDYHIDPRLKNIRNNFLNEARDVLGEKDFNFFRELGNSLISD